MDSVVSETRAASRKTKANQKVAGTSNSNTHTNAAAGRASSTKAKANTDAQANKGSSKSKSIATTSPRHSDVQQQQKKQQTSSSKSDKVVNTSKLTGSGRTVFNKSDMSSDDIGEYCIGVA
jgi:hypothetical protein